MMMEDIEYKFDRPLLMLPEEKEIRVAPPDRHLRKPKVSRRGLPQGLSISPILATSVLDSFKKLEGLVMYADDGIIIREKAEDDHEVTEWFRQLSLFGVEVEPEKSGIIKGKFKFLGVEFDLEKGEVKHRDSVYSWKGKDTQSYETAQEIYQ